MRVTPALGTAVADASATAARPRSGHGLGPHRRAVASIITALAAANLALAPGAFADDADTQFIGEVSFFLPDTYLDPPTIRALIDDARKVCSMSDAGFSDEAMQVIDARWDPADIFGFMGAATRAYCPEHLGDWSGL